MHKTILTALMVTAMAAPITITAHAGTMDAKASTQTEAQADTGFFAKIGNSISGFFGNKAQAGEKTSAGVGTSVNADIDADVKADAETSATTSGEAKGEAQGSTQASSETSAESSAESKIEPSAGAKADIDADVDTDVNAGGIGASVTGKSKTGISVQ